jgi:hypothetical protein
MNDDTKTVLRYAAIIVGALLLLWVGIRLTSSIIASMIPIIASSIQSVVGFLGFLITTGVVLLTAAVAVAVPVAVIAVCAIGFLKLIEVIRNEIAPLKSLLSKQAREAAIDATFLAIVALLAGLMFFMVTEDWLKNFSTIRVLVIAAVACSISKMLMLFPLRSTKIAGILITGIVLIGLSVFVAARYRMVSSSGISLEGLRNAWQHQPEERSIPFLLFGIGTIGLLLVVSVFYPFTAQGWRRIWKTE